MKKIIFNTLMKLACLLLITTAIPSVCKAQDRTTSINLMSVSPSGTVRVPANGGSVTLSFHLSSEGIEYYECLDNMRDNLSDQSSDDDLYFVGISDIRLFPQSPSQTGEMNVHFMANSTDSSRRFTITNHSGRVLVTFIQYGQDSDDPDSSDEDDGMGDDSDDGSALEALGGTNYVAVRTYLDDMPGTHTLDVEYYDGLGYLVQKQSSHASPSGGVLVQPVVYDSMRRADATAYLPYSSIQQDMMFRQNAVSEQGTWYASRFGGDRYAFSNTVYESGPQGRPVSTMKPGSVYRSGNHSATVDYALNEEADSVRRIGFDPLGFCVLPDGYYPEHSVRRVTSTD